MPTVEPASPLGRTSGAGPLVGILALQGDFAAHAAVLERLGARYRFVRRAEDLDGLDALILPGGESSTMLKLLEAGGFFARLRAVAAARPALATCAGAILLARRVGSPEQPSLGLLDLTAERNAYGRQIDSSIRPAQVRAAFVDALGTATLEAVLIRAPQFRELGPGVEVVAEADGEPVLVRQGNLFAASFHPELSSGGDYVHRWFLQVADSRRDGGSGVTEARGPAGE